MDSGALDALVPCLEDFDPTVKEAAAWAIGYISQHTAELAQVRVTEPNDRDRISQTQTRGVDSNDA